MIKPEYIENYDPPPPSPSELKFIEQEFDRAITSAAVNQKWPAPVPMPRDIPSAAALDETVKRYRAIGWDVTISRDIDTLAVISKRKPPG